MTPAAKKDYLAIYKSIAIDLRSPTIADDKTRMIDHAIKSLATTAGTHRVFKDATGETVYILTVAVFHIVYRVKQDCNQVEVLNVLYGELAK